MKSYNNIDAALYDREGLIQDFRESAKDHGNSLTVESLYENLDYHVETLSWHLEQNTFMRNYHKTATVNEHSCKKTRDIQKPWFFYEQPAHHSLIRALKPIFDREMYGLSCGSIPDRGPHYGKRRIEHWIRKDPKNCKYFLKFDIRHFFQNISHRILKKIIKRKIRDEVFRKKLYAVIDTCRQGVPIGYFTSGWFGNYYLTPLDHMISTDPSCAHMIRYMDDVVIFGPNKKKLHALRIRIEEYLRSALKLEMKGDWQVCRFIYEDRKGKTRGRALDFMGFKFYRNRTVLRKGNLYRTRKKVNKIRRKGKITWKDAASLLSRMGWITHTDTYGYYKKYIKPYINVKKLKKIVSKHTRRERKEHEMVQSRIRHQTGRNRRNILPTVGLLPT